MRTELRASELGIARAAEKAARFVFVVVCALLACSSLLGQDAVVAFRRAEHLKHGINLSHWFGQAIGGQYTKEHFDTYDTAQDMALIKQMGFDHVRFTVNCEPMFQRGQADRIPPEYLAMVDGAVKMILDQGLAIIIDIHPESELKARLAAEDVAVEQFEDFWRALAKHYSNLDPEKVFFEILNEPEFKDRYRWEGVQARLARAIREGAPNHTIIAAGANWSSNSELLFLEPLRDPNIIYNFHFYDPHIFTHQGATWSTNFQHYLTKLPYPSSPVNVKSTVAQAPDAVNQLAIVRYGLDRWDAARIDAEIGIVAEWGKRWHVPVTCNEFGVYRATVAPEDRLRWIHDVRTALEKYGMGWTMWDYAGGFSVVVNQNGARVVDEETVKALGLKK
jgi:endoglucanase